MASTYEGRSLTERHRRAQIGLRAQFLRAFTPDWSILDWTRIDATAVAWARAAKETIRIWRQRSADLSEDYYRQYRDAEKPLAATPAPIIDFAGQDQRPSGQLRGQSAQPPAGRSGRTIKINGHVYEKDEQGLVRPRIDWTEFDKAVERSLLVTGPGELKRRAAKHESEEMAMRSGLVTASNAASRHVLNGGRETLLTLAEADDEVQGYIRITDGDPCYYCAMLASRGVVFKSGQSFSKSDAKRTSNKRFEGSGLSRNEAKVHDNCACTIEAVLVSKGNVLPAVNQEFQDLWNDNIRNKYSGKAAIYAWRQLYERQQHERGQLLSRVA